MIDLLCNATYPTFTYFFFFYLWRGFLLLLFFDHERLHNSIWIETISTTIFITNIYNILKKIWSIKILIPSFTKAMRYRLVVCLLQPWVCWKEKKRKEERHPMVKERGRRSKGEWVEWVYLYCFMVMDKRRPPTHKPYLLNIFQGRGDWVGWS